MPGRIDLNGTWELTYSDETPEYYLANAVGSRAMLSATVPAPVHRVLLDAGLIEDPNIAMNSLKARWVEETFWVYRRTFDVPEEAVSQCAWLTFARLELNATIYLNGEEVGAHASANRPAAFEVTGKLRAGANRLAVIVETGVHAAVDKPASDYAMDWSSKLTRRPWQRKPQHQSGWDWHPRLMNVGILGDVALEWHAGPRLEQTAVFATVTEDLSAATVHIRAWLAGAGGSGGTGVLRARVVETGAEVSDEVACNAGPHELAVGIDAPRLWWPVGHGEHSLYTVEVSFEASGETQKVTRQTGVRSVEIDQTPDPEGGSLFVLCINNRRVFCKGANWVPPDLFYSEVTPERYTELVDVATQANFNLLRIWGGGSFADHALCQACDERGILIWHDLLFACSKYPGDDPAFAAEVRTEVSHAMRDMAHHPSLVVWCGNNEIEWGDWHWGYDAKGRTHPHYALFHHDLPRIAHAEDPSAAYWISSPYSPEVWREPNDPTAGDQHPWTVSIEEPGGADFWHYRAYKDRFPNEGGVLGAAPPATLRQFLPPDQRHVLSPSWHHHDNPFAYGAEAPGLLGRAYQTVQMWTGRDPMAMDLDAYAFASALLQAEGLQEYIANYRRRMFDSASAVFWMYNDSWPVTHGWTIVDYYRRKKLAYHPVRRAFQPVTVVIVEEGDAVNVYGINETQDTWSGLLRFGVFTLAGEMPMDHSLSLTLPPNASTHVAFIPRDMWKAERYVRSGAFAMLMTGGRTIAQTRLFIERFKDLRFARPEVAIEREEGAITLRCPVFAWGVCLDVDGELPLADNCIDLLPDVPYRIAWTPACGDPRVVAIGSRDVVG